MPRLPISGATDLREGESLKFRFERDGQEQEGFLLRRGGRLYAYLNRCRHIPMTMDWVENRFLSRDGCHIQCATHGALYEVETGLCIAGPPEGKRLEAFEVEIDDDTGAVTVVVPETGA